MRARREPLPGPPISSPGRAVTTTRCAPGRGARHGAWLGALLVLTVLAAPAARAAAPDTPDGGGAAPATAPTEGAATKAAEEAKAEATAAAEAKAKAKAEAKAEAEAKEKAAATKTKTNADGDRDAVDRKLEQIVGRPPADKPLGGWQDKPAERPRSYPFIEHHGYFRFRTDLFYNGHLGTNVPADAASGTSAIPAPLSENAVNNGPNPHGPLSEDAKTIASANLRFRYQPTIHIAEGLRIHATFDVLDNLVLGSTPDFAGNLVRPDVPLVAFSGAQASPSAGVNGFRDAVRIKEAYAEWKPLFLLRAGRMASNWGLGILANGGQDIDDDYGDYTDRVMLALKFYGIYVVGAWDFVYSGATTDDPGDNFGQPKDLGQGDDVTQWVLSLFQRPLSAAEKEERRAALMDRHEAVFDWGVYGVFRKQEFDLSGDAFDLWRTSGGKKTYDQLDLVPRRAWAAIPDLWLRYEHQLNADQHLRLELEAVGIFGHVDSVTDDPTVSTKERSIQQLGLAFEGSFTDKMDAGTLAVGLDAGAASGDSAKGFGVEDHHTLSEGQNPNTALTAFKFDRDYQIDLMLFREVIGTVTNAVYIKPWVSFDFFNTPEEALGARVDLLYAQALKPSATPGNDPFLGFEADLRLFYEDKGRFNFDVESGFLVPGAAFNYRNPGREEYNRDASFGFTVQGRMTLRF